MKNNVPGRLNNEVPAERVAQHFAAAGQGGWSAMYAEMQLAASLPALPIAGAPVRASERVSASSKSRGAGGRAKRREVRSTVSPAPVVMAGLQEAAVSDTFAGAVPSRGRALDIVIHCATAARTVGGIALGWLRTQRVQRTTGRRLRVLETVSLGEKRFAALLSVDGAEFLIGGSGSSVSLLASVDNKAAGEFGQALQQASAGQPQ